MQSSTRNRHFIIFANPAPFSSTLTPPPLIPLGHQPMICILLQTLNDVAKGSPTTLIVRPETRTMFEREMRRWFPGWDISIWASLNEKTSAADLLACLQDMTKPEYSEKDALCLLQWDFPLISKTTLDDFLFFAEDKEFAVLGAGYTRWNKDRPLYPMEHRDHRVVSVALETLTPTETGKSLVALVPCVEATRGLLLKTLPLVKEYFEILNVAETRAWLCRLPPHPSELDTISIRCSQDKVFAEHRFMEKKHADFLSQCFALWNRCKMMDQRIETLENMLKK